MAIAALSSPLPHHSEIDVHGIRTHYRHAGSGSPFLLVHGGDFRTFGHGSDWDPLIPRLADRFAVFAPDRLGQGRTANPRNDADFTMTRSIAHLLDFVDELGLKDLVVIGHSRGALPALWLALEHPDAVRGLVIVDSNTLNPAPPAGAGDFYAGVFDNIADEPDAEQVSREVILNSFSTRHVTEEYVAALIDAGGTGEAAYRRRLMQADEHRTRFLADVRDLRDRALARVDAGEVAIPTLLVWAREDPSAPLGVGLDLFERLASAGTAVELHVVSRSGHYPHREQPAAMAGVVAAFVDGIPSDVSRSQLTPAHSRAE